MLIARQRDTDPGKCPQFSFDKKDRRVTVYYFYLWDVSSGPAFIKVCTYCPWPMKMWVNGHEWAKQQARKIGFSFIELSNGFGACEEPAVLQRICDALQHCTINVFFQRWLSRLPLPLGAADQRARYWWSCRWRRSRCPAPSCSPSPATPRRFSMRWSPTTLTWAARTPSRSSSVGGSSPASKAPSRQVQDQGHHQGHQGHHQRLLPPLPDQAIPQRRPGAAHRDRHQLTHRPADRPPSALPERTAETRACDSTTGCCTLNVPARAASLRIQSSSGSRAPPSMRRDGELRSCALATLGSRPWPVPSARPWAPSPASPTGACAP